MPVNTIGTTINVVWSEPMGTRAVVYDVLDNVDEFAHFVRETLENVKYQHTQDFLSFLVQILNQTLFNWPPRRPKTPCSTYCRC